MWRVDLADDLMHDGNWFERSMHRSLAWMAGHRRATMAAMAATAIVSSVCVNALAWQDGPHPSAFFETRPVNDGPQRAAMAPAETGRTDGRAVTRIVFGEQAGPDGGVLADVAERPLELPASLPRAAPGRDEARQHDTGPVAQMQKMLASLGYYDGEIDGLEGPMTQAAVETYKNNVGLRGIDLSDADLLTSLRNNMTVTAAIPAPRPASGRPDGAASSASAVATSPARRSALAVADPAPAAVTDRLTDRLTERMMPAANSPAPDPLIMKVQAGLRAFGRTELQVDGLKGAATRAAVREFQSIFRLPVTGDVDPAMVEKMAAVGLID